MNTKDLNVKSLGKSEQERLIKQAEDEAEKKVNEAEAKRKDQAKRLDYVVRAIRDSELPLLEQKYKDMLVADEALFKTKVWGCVWVFVYTFRTFSTSTTDGTTKTCLLKSIYFVFSSNNHRDHPRSFYLTHSNYSFHHQPF